MVLPSTSGLVSFDNAGSARGYQVGLDALFWLIGPVSPRHVVARWRINESAVIADVLTVW